MEMNWFTASVICAIIGIANGQGSNTTLNSLKNKVKELLRGNADLTPKLVRMIYHDCVGGCDGCIDLSNEENAGLENVVSVARRFRTENAPLLSQADVNALLGIVAAEFGVEQIGNNKRINIPFLIGRRDCSPGTVETPVPRGNRIDTISFLTQEFRLSQTEAVALMGAHSLGRCRPENSGFVGRWDSHEFQLDNGYFRNMVARLWVTQRQDNDRVRSTQWVKNDTDFFMLHADMIMLKRFRIRGDFDTPSCTFDSCPASATARTVNNFANDEDLFLRTFQTAFRKMINGRSTLRPFQ